MFCPDYVLNGQGHGPVAGALANVRYDAGLLRPYLDEKGRPVVTVNTGRFNDKGQPIYQKRLVSELAFNGMPQMVNNATSLRKLEWEQLDRVVLRAARQRLRAWADLASANTYGGFNGMGKMVLEHETMSDPGEALIDFSGLSEDRNDAPQFQLEGLPLPIIHSGFWFDLRRLTISRNTGTPLDSVMAEAAGRRVAETIEKLLVGTIDNAITAYGGGTNSPAYGRAAKVYGYTNFTSRLTKTNLTAPTGSNASTTLAEVLAMIDQLTAQNFYGPFMLYHSNNWDQYMDNDYILTGGNVATQTLRQRLRSIEVIQDVRRLDFFDPTAVVGTSKAYQMLLVQMTPEVARAVNGMDITTVQWPTMGGMKLNFKVMAIQVPQLRADFAGRCGILHAYTAS